MSPFLIVLVVAFLLAVFSQFGGRLMARTSLTWGAIAAFLLVAVVDPAVFRPVAHLLGIEVVSNFVLAAMVCILFFQLIELNSLHTTTARKLRKMASSLAVSSGFEPSPASTPGPLRALVVVPCYNEEENLPHVLQALASLPPSPSFVIDYCIVNDGSVDGSAEILRQAAPGRHVNHPVNVGVAGVLMTGFALVRRFGYDYAVQCDADGQHPVHEIPRLLDEARRGSHDLLIGSRFHGPAADGASTLESTTATRRMGSVVISCLIRIFWPRVRCTDPTSGFRAYSQRACQVLAAEMPDEYPEPESIPIVASHRLRIAETAVRMAPRVRGTSSLGAWSSLRFMIKVVGALTGLRLRRLVPPSSR